MPYRPAANGTRVRLGFPVKVLGAAGLRSHDSRRWQNQPHLSVSLAYLRDIFLYLERKEIRFYRMAGQLAPYLTHPELPAFHNQLDECSTELAAIGDLARQQRVRLTLHPGFYVQLSHPDANLAARSGLELAAATSLLDRMGWMRPVWLSFTWGAATGIWRRHWRGSRVRSVCCRTVFGGA